MASPTAPPIILAVEQSLNDPPVLMATDRNTGIKKRLLDPNSWLAERRFGRVEVVSWQANGNTWTGGLYYPPDYERGKRYPVLLQTHGFAPDRFSLYGYAKNFPGHALAAHGIFVLQIGEYNAHAGTQKQWAEARAGYEGAIDRLDSLGLVDRGRVGMVGWSATGSTAAYMLTHSEYPIAAAAFTSTGIMGWWLYLQAGAPEEADGYFDAAPFGMGIASWLEQSPSFNLNRVRAPILAWNDLGMSGIWDWHAGLKRLGKPVEFWILPTGTHDIYQASQRLHTVQLLVDWFRFWLKDEEDSAPEKADRYGRWRTMRAQQDSALEEPRPPLLDWKATPAQ